VTALLVVVVSALSLGMGVILYISAVNDEVAHRKKSPVGGGGGGGGDDELVEEFSYHYGWAFFFGGATFVCAMAAAVSNISLYLHRYSHFDDMMLLSPAPVGGGGGGGGAAGSAAVGGCNSAAETSSDGAGVYRPVRWADPDDSRYAVGSGSTTPRRWTDAKTRKLSSERADRRLYESNHSITIPL